MIDDGQASGGCAVLGGREGGGVGPGLELPALLVQGGHVDDERAHAEQHDEREGDEDGGGAALAVAVHTPHRMTPVTVMGQEPASTNGMLKSIV